MHYIHCFGIYKSHRGKIEKKKKTDNLQFYYIQKECKLQIKLTFTNINTVSMCFSSPRSTINSLNVMQFRTGMKNISIKQTFTINIKHVTPTCFACLMLIIASCKLFTHTHTHVIEYMIFWKIQLAAHKVLGHSLWNNNRIHYKKMFLFSFKLTI